MLKARPTDIKVTEVTTRIRAKMRRWGVTLSFLADRLDVSRQYAWQIVHCRTALSLQRAIEIEAEVDRIVVSRAHMQTLGDRLRAARLSAGMTLKQAAGLIGYSWVGVERWEKNLCLPKAGVLLNLLNLYKMAGGAIAEPHLAFSHASQQYLSVGDTAFQSTGARTIPL